MQRDKLLLGVLVLLAVFIVGAAWYESRPMPKVDNVKVAELRSKGEITEDEIFVLTNVERVKAGLKPLKKDEKLTLAAYAKAKHMLDNDYWAHDTPEGWKPWDFISASGYRYGWAGENLAKDYSKDEDIVKGWMDSKLHRDNILNPLYEETGIAVVDGTLVGSDTTLVVQMFAESK